MANKQRLIDANEFIKSLEWEYGDVFETNEYGDGEYGFSQEAINELVQKAPTVDAVEVVRCKDCEFWGGVTFGNVCRRWSAPLAGMKNCTKPDDFCSYGERRTDV